ncbi:MAG TPA: hypothetical protein VLA76_06815 [Candidatus Angelobacter sp.]|nr:hypothetical protein [Candidatus Angelobacter sp.]
MEPSVEATPASIPVGRSGRLEATALAAAGDHAILVREAGDDRRGRVLLTTDKLGTGERLVVMPLDDEVEVRVDGDALAVWLGAGSIQQVPPQHVAMDPERVPAWATLVGGALLLLVVAFAVIGSAVAFAWIASLLS